MARNYLRTVTDMERYYYGAGSNMGFHYSGSELLKADAPLLSTTAGTYQAIYGRKVWSQLNQEFNAFSILPKKPWDRSGWRVVTARPDTTKGGGIAENGTLPDTTKPTFQNIAAKPKTIAHTFDMSEVAIFLNDKDDGLGDIRSVLKEEMGKHHAEEINKMLLQDVTTPAGNDYESLDRVTSGSITASGDAADTMDFGAGGNDYGAAGDEDIYSIDRSANSWSKPRSTPLVQREPTVFSRLTTSTTSSKRFGCVVETPRSSSLDMIHLCAFNNFSSRNSDLWKRSVSPLPSTV